MKRNHLFVLLTIALVGGLAWFFLRGDRSGTLAIDLFTRYPAAEKRSNMPLAEAFSERAITINNETKRSIFMHPTSRLIFKQVVIPDDAWLRVWVGVDPKVWTEPSDGVLFRFGVSDGRVYDELVRQFVDPANNPNDRRWVPLTIDLAPYAGQAVDLIFNTNSSLPGRGDDSRNDWAVWGAPEILEQ